MDEKGDIYLTLFRTFGLNYPYAQLKRSQLLGEELEWSFIILPLNNNITEADLFAFQNNIQSENIYSFCKAREVPFEDAEATLEFHTHRLVYSILKTAEDGNGIILRVFNPSDKTVIDKLTVDKDKCVFKTNLAEKNLTEITVTNGNAEIIAKPNEIITLRIK